jgi:O-antigen biosynthesis protein
VVDVRMPRLEQDAASLAILSHCKSLLRLGYHVEFAALDSANAQVGDGMALFARGIEAHETLESVEAFLKSRARSYALVYLHRHETAKRLTDVVRQTQPQAKLIYSVADLEFMRFRQQAEFTSDTALAAQSIHLEQEETGLLTKADRIITHSLVELETIQAIPNRQGTVHRLLWDYNVKRGPLPFSQRSNIGFLGSFRHSPNLDGVRHFLDSLWTEISAGLSDGRFEIAGAFLNASDFPTLPRRVTLIGHVSDANAYLSKIRLMVAPLRYGAGVKGKVLQALAAGVPCIMTAAAAEGIGLSEPLVSRLIAMDHQDFITKTINLYIEEKTWRETSDAALFWAQESLSAPNIDRHMAALLADSPLDTATGPIG